MRDLQRMAKLRIIRRMVTASIDHSVMEKTFDAAVADRAQLAVALGLEPGEPLTAEQWQPQLTLEG